MRKESLPSFGAAFTFLIFAQNLKTFNEGFRAL